MIFYLLYYGVESFKFNQNDFDELLKQARERNESLAVTGKLIYCEGTFIQVLEGTEKNVLDIYASIKVDKRLIATKVVTTGTVEKRYFKNWSMDFDEVTLSTINELENCTHPNVTAYITNAPAIKLLKLLTNSK
ncbi:MAG: BLUF domain-containing protein [Pedobacter sp.]|uniref:BLUF domain-containing protein n=1 Tax=Pedobacter sp. TaxID=1411316 RepID=UPI002807031E|nr:BLUF domain-containing protein [Pedobacter sp.]MDQ8003422.1 BLUF domain-containing protein [Pedobacter sp.]